MITAERLRHLLHYDPETGVFTWRNPAHTSPRKAGDIAGGPTNSDGSWSIRLDYKLYKAHRLAWLYMTGQWPTQLIDHRDTDSANNRWRNLRDASCQMNSENQRRPHRDARSGFLGVTANHKRWMAQISSGGRYHYLGTFDTPQEAHEVYVSAKREIHAGATL